MPQEIFKGFNSFQLLKIKMTSDSYRIANFFLDKSLYKNGKITLSIAEICDACWFSKTKRNQQVIVPKCLKELCDLNLIKIEKNAGGKSTYILQSISVKIKEKQQEANMTNVIKFEKIVKKKHQIHDDFCDQIAIKWVQWRKENGMENGNPIEEYAQYIRNAYPNLQVSNHKFWMEKIFEHIKSNDFWQRACDTPHQLCQKMHGTLKILKIYQDLNSAKNKKKLLQETFDSSLKDDEEYQKFTAEIGF